jgi:hypothetical protein
MKLKWIRVKLLVKFWNKWENGKVKKKEIVRLNNWNKKEKYEEEEEQWTQTKKFYKIKKKYK